MKQINQRSDWELVGRGFGNGAVKNHFSVSQSSSYDDLQEYHSKFNLQLGSETVILTVYF